MNILIDGHALSDPIKTGKHFHTISLLKAILSHKNSSKHSFHLLVTNTHNLPLKSQRLKIIKARSGLAFYLDFYNLQKNYKLIISPTSYIPPLLTKNKSITFIYDLSVYSPSLKPNKKAQIIEKLLLPKVVQKSHLITMTDTIKNELIQKFPHQKLKIDVIPGFSKFSGKKNPKLNPPQTPYLLFVGTNEPRKNLTNTLIGYGKALIKLKSESKTLPYFYIVGAKGWHQKNIQHIVDKLDLTKYVKMFGYISDKKLSHLYQQSLFISYIPHYEGFGLPIIEAIVHQKTVLTGTHPVLKEVLGPCGISINPKDADKIAYAMHQLISDPHLRSAYEKKTGKWSQNFTAKNSANLFYKILNYYSR